ncbi:MAG: 2-oxoacid:acceptor oxidoreductase family protein [Chloroflexi bacterium]|nr:2-oxoacid:acceptor oxidoreductase family protein [Chloroflexota bacterium]
MVDKMVEIRWHGRGGQGAATAGRLLAEATLERGFYAQAFAEFGPERRGAPVQAYVRLSPKVIRAYYGITNPDIVVVLDPTLLSAVNVAQGLAANGTILVNTRLSAQLVREKLGLEGPEVFAVDASGIAQQCIGVAIPNTAMIGALVKVKKLLELEDILDYYCEAFSSRYSQRMLEGNLNAMRRAHGEVRSQ